jgi:hypothetical protein
LRAEEIPRMGTRPSRRAAACHGSNEGQRFKVHVRDEVDLKIELEVESDARELEIELTW